MKREKEKGQRNDLGNIHHILCIFTGIVTALSKLYICTFGSCNYTEGMFFSPSKDHPYNNTNNIAMLGTTTYT